MAAAARRMQRFSDTLVRRPPITIGVLAAVGLAVRHAWLTTRPLAAGDWHWPSRGRLLAWFPWPTVWDSTLGLGGENRFLEVFRFPIFALSGLVGAAGGTWTLAEKVVYFLPYAILLPIAGWLLAREILGPTRWALLAPVLFLGNTYFLLEADGHVPLPLAEVLACFALVAFLRAMRTCSRRYALIAGLLVSAAAVCDVRAAYIVVWLMAAYLVVLALCEPGVRLLLRRVWLSAVAGLVFGATQAFWIVPLITYHGHPGFPTPQAPNFNIITLSHGIAGLDAAWSGGAPATLVQAPLNPLFMVLPLLAMLALVGRRVRPELLWLALVAVIFAFLAKTNTPPLGGLYNWLYLHLPGFNLFREGSKFLFPVGVAYAIMVPASLQSLYERSREMTLPLARWVRGFAVGALVAVLALMASTIVVLERGQLGSSTTPSTEPASFSQISNMINADGNSGPVLWFGSSVFTTSEGKTHRYVITSSSHPIVNLTGIINTTKVNQRDNFQYFCPAINQAFCYLRPDLFPYLVNATGTSFVVSPASPIVGNLPRGVTRSWLRQQLTAILGPPTVVGPKATQLLVWKVPTPTPAIAGYPAVALVDSGPWSTGPLLPALEAMGVPAAYRQSFDRADFPPAPAALPDSVAVVPYLDGGCRSTDSRDVGILAQSSAASVNLTVGGTASQLPLLARSPRLTGWGLYGPLTLPAGFTPVTAAAGGSPLVLGPCVQWSPLTAVAFGDHSQVVSDSHPTAHGEELVAKVTVTPLAWLELRRLYDPGWRIGGRKPQAVADGLFNLYHDGRVAHGQVRFNFSTRFWEHLGLLIAGVSLLVVVVLLIRSKRPASVEADAAAPGLEGRVASVVGLVGLSLLAATAIVTVLQWLGAPTRFPRFTIGPDPYTIDQAIGSLALATLAASVLLRLGLRVFDRIVAPAPRETTVPDTPRRRVKTLVPVALCVCLLASACTGSASSGASALSAAQVAEQPSTATVGQSIDEALLEQAAKKPRLCIADYTKALKTFPTLASAYSGRAACYLSGAINAAAAVHDDSRALSLSPPDATQYLNRAFAYRAVGNLGAAVKDLFHAVAVPSVTSGEVLTAVDAILAIGTVAQARSMLSVVRSRLPDSAIVEVAAADIAVAADDGSAAQDFTRAQAVARPVSGDEALVLAHLCHWQLLRNDLTGAIASCSDSVALASGGSGAYDDLAAARLGLGQLDAAIGDVTAAIGAFQGSVGPLSQSAGVDGFGLAGLLEQRGRLEVERHEIALALADFQRAKASLRLASPDFLARLKGDVNSARLD